MSTDSNLLPRAKFHAYIDEQLREDQYAQVEELLDQEPDRFEELQHCQLIAERLHELYDGVLNEPVPSEFYNSIGEVPPDSSQYDESDPADEEMLLSSEQAKVKAAILDRDIDHALHDIDDLENFVFDEESETQNSDVYYDNGIDYPYSDSLSEVDENAGYNALLSEESDVSDELDDDALDYTPFENDAIEDLNEQLLDSQESQLDQDIYSDVDQVGVNQEDVLEEITETQDEELEQTPISDEIEALEESDIYSDESVEIGIQENTYELLDDDASLYDPDMIEEQLNEMDDSDTEQHIKRMEKDIAKESVAKQLEEEISQESPEGSLPESEEQVSHSEYEYQLDEYSLQKEYAENEDEIIEVGDVVKEFAAVTHDHHFAGSNSELFSNPLTRAVNGMKQNFGDLKQKLPNFHDIQMPMQLSQLFNKIKSRNKTEFNQLSEGQQFQSTDSNESHEYIQQDSFQSQAAMHPDAQQAKQQHPDQQYQEQVSKPSRRRVKNLKPAEDVEQSIDIGMDVNIDDNQDLSSDMVEQFASEFEHSSASQHGTLQRLKSSFALSESGSPAWVDKIRVLLAPLSEKIAPAKHFVKQHSPVSSVNLNAIKWMFAGIVIAWFISIILGSSDSVYTNEDAENLAVDTHVLHAAFNNNMIQTDAAINQSLMSWISEKQGATLKLLDLDVNGFVYTGTTLVPTERDYLSYNAFVNKKSERIGLITAASTEAGDIDSMRCSIPGKVDGLCSWVKNSVLYVAVGNISLSRVREFALQIASLQ